MKITKKILQRLIEQEVKALLIEQGIDPVTGQPVTIGGQDDSKGIALGRSDKLAANYTGDRPTEEEFANEPVATYVMQRLDGVVAELHEMINNLYSRLYELEDPDADAEMNQDPDSDNPLKKAFTDQLSNP